MVVLAHLAVASTPCFETELEVARLAEAGVLATHHAPAQPVRAEPAAAAAPAAPAVAADARVVPHQLHTLCLCGCSSNSQTPGTTTSARLGFALLPADAPVLAEAEPAVGVRASIPLPVPVADALDHVPIFS
jgi:hypothetical protein